MTLHDCEFITLLTLYNTTLTYKVLFHSTRHLWFYLLPKCKIQVIMTLALVFATICVCWSIKVTLIYLYVIIDSQGTIDMETKNAVNLYIQPSIWLINISPKPFWTQRNSKQMIRFSLIKGISDATIFWNMENIFLNHF